MFCALDKEQIRDFRARIFGKLYEQADKKQPVDVDTFIKEVHEDLLEASKDEEGKVDEEWTNTLVGLVPEIILRGVGHRDLMNIMPDNTRPLKDLVESFSDPVMGYDNVVKYLAPEVPNIEELNADFRADQLEPKEDEEDKTSAEEITEMRNKLFFFDTAYPTSPWATTGQQSTIDKFGKYTNTPNPEEDFYYNVNNKLVDAIRNSGELTGETLTYSGHTGFKLSIVRTKNLPGVSKGDYSQLRLRTQRDLTTGELSADGKTVITTPEEFKKKKLEPGVVAVITNNEGEPLYFNDKGEITTIDEGGKIVYQTIRTVQSTAKGLEAKNIASVSEIVNKAIDERAVAIGAIKKKGESVNDFAARIGFDKPAYEKDLNELRQKELQQILDIRNYLTTNPQASVVLDITGGSKGYYGTKITPLSKFNIDPTKDVISPATENTPMRIAGYTYLVMDGLETPIELKQLSIVQNEPELITNIAQVLSRDLTLSGIKLTNLEKYNYVVQFFTPGKNGIKFFYDEDTHSLSLNILGTKINLLSQDKAALEKQLVELLSKANPYFSVNKDVLATNEITTFNIKDDVAKATKSSYLDYIIKRNNALAEPAADGRVYALNGYLTFEVPQDQLDKIHGKVTSSVTEPVIETVIENVETNHPAKDNPVDYDDLGELTRSRILKSGASTDEITAAMKWWKSHPLSKFVPLNQMVNITNSDAWATWTTAGITLYNGSNYTDIYHEAWHAFSQLYLSIPEKKKLYQSVKDAKIKITLPDGTKVESNLASNRQIEEYLAEEFRNFSMGDKPSKTLPKAARNIFQKIWDFIKSLFAGLTPKDIAVQQAYIQPVQDLFDNLYFANKTGKESNEFLNHYTPNISNVMFGSLRSGAVALEDADTSGLSFDEEKLVISSIDSLISTYVDSQNLKRQDRLASAKIFSNFNNQVALYSWVKGQLQKKLDELTSEYNSLTEEQKLEYDNQILANDIKSLKWAVDNTGDIEVIKDTLRGTQKKGMIARHREKSVFKDVLADVVETAAEKEAAESTESATSDADVISKGLHMNDRRGNELSIKQLASLRTLYLIQSLHQVDSTGKVTRNRLGFPNLVNFGEAWNSMVRNLAGSSTPEELYSRLADNSLLFKKEELKEQMALEVNQAQKAGKSQAEVSKIREKFKTLIDKKDVELLAKSSFGSFVQLADKLGPPTGSSTKGLSDSEFDMWTAFWQDFNKPRIPLVQMTNSRNKDYETEEVTFSYSIGRVSSELIKVQRDWSSDFKKQNPADNKYVQQDNNKNNFLNLERIVSDFGTLNKSGDSVGLIPGKEFEFLRSIGIYLDNKPEIRSIINSDKSLEISRLFTAINYLYKSGKIVHEPLKVLTDGFAYSYKEGDKVISNTEPSQYTRLNAIANIQSTYSDSYSNLSVTTATNEKAYEHSLNNSMTVILDAVNKAKTFQDLYDPNGATPWMNYMDPRRNPGILSSQWLNSVFILNINDPLFGTRRKESTLVDADFATIDLENLSGIQMTNEGLFFDKGVNSSNASRIDKFLSDFHMMLDSGHHELMKHASKSSAYGAHIKHKITYSGKKQHHLYVDTDAFLAPTTAPKSIASVREVSDIVLGYLKAEVLRAGLVRNNPEIYKDYTSYSNGTSLTIFDDIIQDKEKSIVLGQQFLDDLSKVNNDIIALLNTPEYAKLGVELRTQIGKYFDSLALETKTELEKAEYISPQLYARQASNPSLLENPDYKLRLRNAMIKSYTVNTWIHNVESTFVFYGDLVQFNHSKDDFNKRNAGIASTGYMFRTDKAAQDFINSQWKDPRPYFRKLVEEGKLSGKMLNRQYDGTFNTAIIQEAKIKSAYYDFYADLNEKFYKDLYKKEGYKGKELTDKVNTEVYGPKGVDKDGKPNGIRTNPSGGIMKAYFEMDEGDGQGYVTFDSYRMMKKLESKWSDAQENLFMEIVAGKNPSPKEMSEFFPPYKVQYWGPLKTENLPVTAFHKFSLFPLIPTAIKDTQLEKLHNKMVEQGIDYSTFQSGSKLGTITTDGKSDEVYTGPVENRQFNDNVVFTPNVIYLNYLKDQLDINNEFKGSVIFSTQLRKLAIQGLYKNGIPADFMTDKPFKSREDAWSKLKTEKQKEESSKFYKESKNYETLVDKITELKRLEFLKQAGWEEDENGNLSGNSEDLVRFVQAELKEAGLSEHDIDFLNTDETTGEPIYDWSGSLIGERLERMLIALVNNKIIKQKMSGEPLIQVAGSFFEKPSFTKPTAGDLTKYGTNQLPTYHPGTNGNTTAMKVKVALQGDFNNLLKLKDKEGKSISQYITTEVDGKEERTLDFEKSLAKLNDLLKDDEWLDMSDNRKKITMVGVRIPVQGLNSMEFMEVYEFLPPSAGNILIAPSEIVAKSGADFDIDKLTVFTPKITSQGDFLETSYSSPEEIQVEIDKLNAEQDVLLKKIGADLSLTNIKKDLKGGIKERNAAIKSLAAQISLFDEKNQQLVSNIRTALLTVIKSKKLDSDTVEIIKNGTDEELQTLVRGLNKSKQLWRISKEAALLNTESWENYKSRKEVVDQIKLTAEERKVYQEGQEQVLSFKKKISSLNEQKRNFIATYENKMITSIRSILELPENFITLTRPNGTDLVKGVADELMNYVQEKNHKKSKLDSSVKKKGISPTRVLEPMFVLDKHQDNNIGKTSLGIAAITNPANTTYTRIGGSLPPTMSFLVKNAEGKLEMEEMPVTLYLNHNKVGDRISMSHIYDTTGTTKIADIISQLMNGFVDVEKDAWVAYIQGNPEVLPILLSLVEAGTPFREAAYFVSNPLVREYVREQRKAKGIFAGPLKTEPINEETNEVDTSLIKSIAVQNIWAKYNLSKSTGLKRVPTKLNLYKTIDSLMTEIGGLPIKTLEKIVATNSYTVNKDAGLPENSKETVAAFLHFLQIEKFTSGTKNLRLKTNVDTKKDATLFDAKLREVNIENLHNEEGLETSLINRYLDESIISSFRIQNFQQKLWGRFFKTKNNDVVNEFLVQKALDKDLIKQISKKTGWKIDKIASEFKNNFMLFMFQNYIKSFELGSSDIYKGMKSTDKVPVQYVDKLNAGVLVKEDKGIPYIYIDQVQLEKDWNTQVFAQKSGAGSYGERGLAEVPVAYFTFKGNQSKKEYTNFVIEREYLRYMLPMSKAKDDQNFKTLLNNVKTSTTRDEKESESDYNTRITSGAYEMFLRNLALDNTQNFKKIFYSKTSSMGQQLLDIIKNNEHLTQEYPILGQFAIRVSDRPQEGLKGLTNILLKDQRDMDADTATSYHDALKKLADPTVIKVKDKSENDKISSYFRALPLFAFMQSGMSKGEFSFTNVVPYGDFMNIMEEPIRAFNNFLKWQTIKEGSQQHAKVLANSNAFIIKPVPNTDMIQVAPVEVLNRYWSSFVNLNSLENVANRGKFMNYLYDTTPLALLEGSRVQSTVAYSPFLLPTNREFTYRLLESVVTEGVDEKGQSKRVFQYLNKERVTELANANPNAIFVYDDIYTRAEAKKNNNFPLMKSIVDRQSTANPTINFSYHVNSSGIRTLKDISKAFTPTDSKGVELVKGFIKEDLDRLIELQKSGKSIVFSERGYGQDLRYTDSTAQKEVFEYLSKELYTNFGYVNPGSENVPSVMEIIINQQVVTDEDYINLKNSCLIS